MTMNRLSFLAVPLLGILLYQCSNDDVSEIKSQELVGEYNVTIDSISSEFEPFDWSMSFYTEPVIRTVDLTAENNSISLYKNPDKIIPIGFANGEFSLMVDGGEFSRSFVNISLFQEGNWVIDETTSMLRITSKYYDEQFMIKEMNDDQMIIVKQLKSGVDVPSEFWMGSYMYLRVNIKIYIRLSLVN